MSEHETSPEKLWEQLEAGGELDRIRRWMTDQTSVWIKRSSGAWQEATIGFIDSDRFLVTVQWPNPDRPGKNLMKGVYPWELLVWQKEKSMIE